MFWKSTTKEIYVSICNLQKSQKGGNEQEFSLNKVTKLRKNNEFAEFQFHLGKSLLLLNSAF